MSDLGVSLFDRLESLLVAAARATDATTRSIFTSEALIQIEAARAKFASLGTLTVAQERELERLRVLA